MAHITWTQAWRAGARVLLVGAVSGVAIAACSRGDKAAAAAATPAATGDTPTAGAASPAADPAPAVAQQPDGKQIFNRCATCHQHTGLGIPGAFPPLKGSDWANAENTAVPIRIVLHGLQGLITVDHKRFNSAMPPYGTNQPLNDAEVAAVLTYVRSSWGNTGSAVTAEEVAEQRKATAGRKTPWSPKELEPLLHGSSH